MGAALGELLDKLGLDRERGLMQLNVWRLEVELTACTPPRDPTSMGLNSIEDVCRTFGLGPDLCLASYCYEQYAENAAHVLAFARQAEAFEGLRDDHRLSPEKRALGVR